MADKPDPNSAFAETEAPAARKDGIAMSGKFPLNHRLRAEALSEAGKADDPDGIVTADAIADAGKRLARKAKAAEKAEAKSETKAADPAPAPSSK